MHATQIIYIADFGLRLISHHLYYWTSTRVNQERYYGCGVWQVRAEELACGRVWSTLSRSRSRGERDQEGGVGSKMGGEGVISLAIIEGDDGEDL